MTATSSARRSSCRSRPCPGARTSTYVPPASIHTARPMPRTARPSISRHSRSHAPTKHRGTVMHAHASSSSTFRWNTVIGASCDCASGPTANHGECKPVWMRSHACTSSSMNERAAATRRGAVGVRLGADADLDVRALRAVGHHRVAHEELRVRGHQRVREDEMRAESVAVALVEVADRDRAAREPGRVDVGLAQRLVARPVRAELVMLELVVVEVAERLAVQVPEVVHVDVVLDEQLPVARGRHVGTRRRASGGRVDGSRCGRAARPSASRQRHRIGVGVDEHHAFPHVDRRAEQAARAGVEVGELGAPLGDDAAARRRGRSASRGTTHSMSSAVFPQPSSITIPRCRHRLWNARSVPSSWRTIAIGAPPIARRRRSRRRSRVARRARRRATCARTRVAARARTTRRRCTASGSRRKRVGSVGHRRRLLAYASHPP